MASDVVYDAIKAHVTAHWFTIPMIWENEFPAPIDTAHVIFEIAGTSYAQQTFGADPQTGNRYDEEGYFYMHVLVPAGTGSSTARAYAKQLADLFIKDSLLGGRLEFTRASIGHGIPDDIGKFFNITVTVDWRLIEA